MKRRFEDKLMQRAFGELDAHEAKQVDALSAVDPSVQRSLQELSAFKEDLALLKDIPADQMSPERLRDAILGQGLKPLPPKNSNGWGWVWMPAGAFALAFAFVALHKMQARDPRIVMGSAVAMASRPSGAGKDILVVHHQSKKGASAAKVLVAQKKPRTESKDIRLVRNSNDVDSSLLADTGEESAAVPVLTSQHTVPPPAVSDASAPGPRTASANTPIVMINPEKDNDTGAQKATEVDSASNVVVGG